MGAAWNAFHEEQWILEAVQELAAQLDPEENAADLEKLDKRITKLQERVNKEEAAALQAQQLLDQRRNAFYRQIETEDFRKDIAHQKQMRAEAEEHLAGLQAEVEQIKAELDNTTDAAQRGQLEVTRKVLELDVTDW